MNLVAVDTGNGADVHAPAEAAAAGRCLARELGEWTRAALLYPLGCTTLGSRTLLSLLVPPAQRPPARHRIPVVLVPGFGANRSAWFPLEQRLIRAGFAHVHTTCYNPVVMGLPAIGRALVRDCRTAMDRAGLDRVLLVGHSLGGVVVRYAIQRLGLEAQVPTAVTVATPHRGTPCALLATGGAAAAVQPGSPLLDNLHRSDRGGGVRWLNYYAERDLVVHPGSARLQEPTLHARNIAVPDVGHLGILRAPLLLDSVVRLLREDENRTWDRIDPSRLRDYPRAAAA